MVILMAKRTRNNVISLILLVVIVLYIIPATRVPMQIYLHKGLSYINQSSVIDKDERKTINYSDFTLISETGEKLNFKSTEGKVVFINFWATWCPPCIAEMPSLQKLYKDYNDRVEFLFITNDKLDKVQAFKAKRGFDFEVFNIISGSQNELKTSSIPRTYIINKNGEIVVDESGAVDWNSKKVRNQLNILLSE